MCRNSRYVVLSSLCRLFASICSCFRLLHEGSKVSASVVIFCLAEGKLTFQFRRRHRHSPVLAVIGRVFRHKLIVTDFAKKFPQPGGCFRVWKGPESGSYPGSVKSCPLPYSLVLYDTVGVRGWWRHCCTSWKVAGSIPDGVIGIFHWVNFFWPHCGPGVDSASDRNEYQEYPGGKDGQFAGLVELLSRLSIIAFGCLVICSKYTYFTAIQWSLFE